jgi:protease-4
MSSRRRPVHHVPTRFRLPGQDLWARAAVPDADRAAAAKARPGWERDVLEKLVFASLKEQRSRRWRFSGAWLFWVLLWAVVEVSTAAVQSAHRRGGDQGRDRLGSGRQCRIRGGRHAQRLETGLPAWCC